MKNKIQNAFDNVHAEQSLKDNTRRYLREQTNLYGNGRKKHTSRFLKVGISFACIAVIGLGFGGHYLYFTPVSAISLDVNPSVELNVNRFDRVVSVDAFNDDGKKLTDIVDVKYMNYSDALDKLISSDSIEQYIEKGEEVEITVAGSNEEKSEEMVSSISSCDYAKENGISCSSENKEQADEAYNVGLSLGKYKAYLELAQLNPEVTPEDVQGLTMREIRAMIAKCDDSSHNDESKADTDEVVGTDCDSDESCSGNGQGGGNGQGTGNGQGKGQNQGKHNHS